MHPTLQKLVRDYLGDPAALPGDVAGLLCAIDREFAGKLRPSDHTPDDFATLMLHRVPAIVYATDISPVARCHYASPQIRNILGFEPDDWCSDPRFRYQRLHPEDRATVLEAERQIRETGEPLRIEYRMIAKDGRTVWIRDEGVVARAADGQATMIHGLMYDVTESRRAEEQLLHEATHDGLTSLPNRRLLLDRADHALLRSRRDANYRFALICVGLDRFKVVNESIGPVGGDALLSEFARRLQRCIRPGDTVARIGGDEFALLLEGVSNAKDAETIVARVQAELGKPFDLDGMEVFVTSSFGIVLSRGADDRAQDLLRDADIAMHFAKRDGKARHCVFDANMHAALVQQLQIETDLRRAIDRDEFEVYYQPIVCLHTGLTEALEALVRWRHPERGMVPPMEFIPIAEETGLIAGIERLVMKKACTQAAHWNRRYGARHPLAMSVNLSARRFVQHDLVDEIMGIVTQSGLAPELLKLEITETVIMNNRDHATTVLAQLKEKGIRISMDDFGTGYSSLSYLHRFPIDTVKIDRSFVKVMDAPAEGDEIVRTIITLAHHLNMSVTAEGVETETQLNRLRELGCEFGQGYYFSKPVDAATYEQVLAGRNRKRAAA